MKQIPQHFQAYLNEECFDWFVVERYSDGTCMCHATGTKLYRVWKWNSRIGFVLSWK
jgi:predicted GNAT family acetyltransferase